MLRFALLVLTLATSSQARAHEGPPYPVIEDAALGPARVAVWVDPDVGPAEVFVLYPAPPTRSPDLRVRVVDPATGAVQTTRAHRAEGDRGRFDGRVAFPHAGRFVLSVQDITCKGECVLSAEVEATPPGAPPAWHLALYAFPFAGLAFVWLRALRRAGR